MTHRSNLPFPPFPVDAGSERRCGVEIEFSGLTELDAAKIVARTLGGEVVESGHRTYDIRNTAIGTLKVELDTALRKASARPLIEMGLDLARRVVPVEVITPPLTPKEMPLLDSLREALRKEGAQGSRDGLFFGFGVHLNPEIPSDPLDSSRLILAYGLIEDWLRATYPVDTTRRWMPFVTPWPHSLVDALVSVPDASLDDLFSIYSDHTETRNHGLDLMPLFRHLDPDRFDVVVAGGESVSARPAFHFRLPDCRIDEAGWSLAEPWACWWQVERLAQRTELLWTLCDDWQAFRYATRPMRGEARDAWADQVALRMGDGGQKSAA
ncbi:amidoligase family protein [Marinibacterium profundimaris]|uniref:Amidoligase enzyme n=1 Tax=Marinibacterium profundimaris TaxID=1679460 RepID=A0A225NSA8_9RHOB|nr:amidoligase family protein [Marinibacterium profundimaris]OWU75708.1 hypothetical protein ATO3_05750 [Marinibacterium profundimaris]